MINECIRNHRLVLMQVIYQLQNSYPREGSIAYAERLEKTREIHVHAHFELWKLWKTTVFPGK